MIWSFISDLIASLLLHCCMSLALLPGTSPIVLTQRGKKPRAPQLPLAAREKKGAYFCHMCAPMSSSFQAFVTHNFHTLFVTHHLSHTTFTHNFVTHHLSHTTLSHTISLCHTPSIFHIQLCHTQLFTHNLFYFSILHHLLCPSFLPSFPVPLQHVLLIIGRSWLVGLSGPLILQHCQAISPPTTKINDRFMRSALTLIEVVLLK